MILEPLRIAEHASCVLWRGKLRALEAQASALDTYPVHRHHQEDNVSHVDTVQASFGVFYMLYSPRGNVGGMNLYLYIWYENLQQNKLPLDIYLRQMISISSAPYLIVLSSTQTHSSPSVEAILPNFCILYRVIKKPSSDRTFRPPLNR